MMGLLWENHEVKFAKVGCAGSGNNTLIAAVTGKALRVMSLMIVASNDVDAYVISSGGTELIGDANNVLDMTANMGFKASDVFGVTQTAKGEGLVLNLSAAVSVAGCLSYIEV